MNFNSIKLLLKWASIASCITILAACGDATQEPVKDLKNAVDSQASREVKGALLDANFVSFEDDDCTVKEVSIQTRPNESQYSNNRNSRLELSIRRINECNQDVHVDTTAAWELESSEYTVAEDLSTGSLNISKDIVMGSSGETGKLTINMNWIAQFDEEMIAGSVSLNPSSGYISDQSFAYNYKEAQASGSVILNGLNFTPIDADDAGIVSVN